MAAYIIAQFNNSPDLARYREAVTPLNDRFGARLLARPDGATCVEGAWAFDTIVVLELPSLEAARAFNRSPEYQAVKALRADQPPFTVLIVDGA